MWSRGGVRVPEAPVSALTRVVTRALVRLTEVPSRHAAVETVVYSDVQFWVALSWVCTRPPRAIGLHAAAASRQAVGRGAVANQAGPQGGVVGVARSSAGLPTGSLSGHLRAGGCGAGGPGQLGARAHVAKRRGRGARSVATHT